MIKLKLKREQLAKFCEFTNPVDAESRVLKEIDNNNFGNLDYFFNIMDIGALVTKKYLFSNKKDYTISITYSQASTLLNHINLMGASMAALSYENNLIRTIGADIHKQITNYNPQFNGNINRKQNTIGGDSSFRKALAITTR